MADDITAGAVNAWLSFLVGSVVAYRREINDQALAQHMKNQLTAATPVFKAVGGLMAGSYLRAIVRLIGTGQARGKKGMPTMPYATALHYVKLYMRNYPHKGALADFRKSRHISEDQSLLAGYALAMFTPETGTVDKQEANLDKKTSILPDTVVRSMFRSEETPDQQQHVEELKHLIKRATGRGNSTEMTPEEKEAFKARDPEGFKRMNKVRTNITASWQTFVRNAVRANPAGAGKPVRIASVLAELRKANIDAPALRGLGPLFIGEDCKLYTSANKQINIFPQPGSDIVFRKEYNPRQDNGIIFKYRAPNSVSPPGTLPSKAYTLEWLSNNKSNTDLKVEKARHVIPGQRSKWVHLLVSRDRYTQTIGAIIEILYTYAARIGTPGSSTKDVDTFGITTLQAGQAKKSGAGYILTYPGKDAKPQSHRIVPNGRGDDNDKIAQRVVAVIDRLRAGKRGTDFLWTTPNGARITSTAINLQLKKFGFTITAHKFRNIRGSNLMEQLIAKANIPKGANGDQVSKIVKGLALNVGKLLGHWSGDTSTANTALKSYILPHILAAPFKERGLRVPKWIPRGGGTITSAPAKRGAQEEPPTRAAAPLPVRRQPPREAPLPVRKQPLPVRKAAPAPVRKSAPVHRPAPPPQPAHRAPPPPPPRRTPPTRDRTVPRGKHPPGKYGAF